MIHLSSFIRWRRCCHCNLSCTHFYPMPNQAFGGGIIFNQPHLLLFFNFIDFLLRHQFSTCSCVARNITCTGAGCWLSTCAWKVFETARRSNLFIVLGDNRRWAWEGVLQSEAFDQAGEDRVVRPPLAFRRLTAPVPGQQFECSWGSRWECTWGSRWGRRREGECRLAPLLSHEKPQSGCRRLTSNIVTIRYNFSFEPVPIVITTTNPAKKQRVFSNTGCLNRNKKEN